MRYKIIGADRDTGEDVELVVEAQTREEAHAKANRRGILVSKCVSTASAPPSTSARSSSATMALPANKNANWSPASPNTGRVGGQRTDQVRSGMNPILRMLVVIGVVVVGTIGVIYFTVLRPQEKQIDKTLDSAIQQIDKSKEMAAKNTQRQIANVQQDLHRVTAPEQVQEPVQPVESVAAVQATQAKSRLREFVRSCEGFVREAKALRARVRAGSSYADYSDKLQGVIDAYAQIGSLPDDADAAGFADAAQKAMDQYQKAEKRWAFAIRNNLYLAEKYPIREMLQAADTEVETLVSHFEKLRANAG